MTSSESLSSPSSTSDSEPSKSPSPTISRRGKRRRSLSPRTDEFGRERDRRSSSRSQGSPSHRSRRRESLSPRRSRNSEESQRTDRGKEHQRATSSRRRNEERAPENIQWGRQQQDQEAKRRRLAEFERVPGYQPELLGVSEDGDEEPQEKQKPNYRVSGLLVAEKNTKNGIVLKWADPVDAAKPTQKWRLYPFKDGESLPILHIHRHHNYLIGRERRVADIPTDHPSCSGQHAVIQHRRVGRTVKPYIMDLKSTNGTFLNDEKIKSSRYIELKHQDVLKFGFSSREYVLLNADLLDSSDED